MALSLLLAVQQNPNLPESFRNQALSTANFAISVAQRELKAPVATTTAQVTFSASVPVPVPTPAPVATVTPLIETPAPAPMPLPVQQTITVQLPPPPPVPKKIFTADIQPVQIATTSLRRFTIFEVKRMPNSMAKNMRIDVLYAPPLIEAFEEPERIGSLYTFSDHQLKSNIVFDYSNAKIKATTTVTFTISHIDFTCIQEYDECVFPTLPISNSVTIIP